VSIVISNIDPKPRTRGRHRYVLRINNMVIAYFNHNRHESLATCLRRAANAAAKAKQKETDAIILALTNK
jgi:hypothetical protein